MITKPSAVGSLSTLALAAALLLASCMPSRSPGEKLYRRHCASCHGVTGGGGARYLADEGADLLDETWKYGGDPAEIEYSLVREGVRGHLRWEFSNQERQQLVAHVLELRGEGR